MKKQDWKNSFKRKCIKTLLLCGFCFLTTQSCNYEEGGFLTELDFTDVIIVTGSNGSHRGISAYDFNGQLIKVITDFRTDGGTPRSSLYFGDGVLLTAQDGPDKIDKYNYKDVNKQIFYGSNYLSGAIYDMVQDSRGNVYVVESNNVEKFDPEGNREPFQTGNAFIQGTIGACTISGGRGLFMTDSDHLIVASYNSGRVIVYDVSTDTPACLTSVSVGAQVNGVMLHSNGSLYYTRLNTDAIYRANPDGTGSVTIWAGDTSRINNPADLVELPDGTILVAGISNHQIWRIDEDGNEVGNNPFIADGQTLSVRDIEVIVSDDD